MKNGIPSEDYYRLLEWKDENLTEWKYFSTHNGVERLCDCTKEQLLTLLNNYVKRNLF